MNSTLLGQVSFHSGSASWDDCRRVPCRIACKLLPMKGSHTMFGQQSQPVQLQSCCPSCCLIHSCFQPRSVVVSFHPCSVNTAEATYKPGMYCNHDLPPATLQTRSTPCWPQRIHAGTVDQRQAETVLTPEKTTTHKQEVKENAF